MERIVCEWCKEENEPYRTDCKNCGAQLHVKDRVGDPASKPVMFTIDPSSPAPVQLPTVKPPARRLGIVMAVAVVPLVLVAVAVAVVVGLSTTGSGRNHTTTTTAQPLPNLLTLGGLSGFLSQIQTKFGDTMGYELDVRPDSATLYRPDNANAHKTVEWWYDQNGWKNKGNSHIPPDMTTGDDTVVGDLSEFDVQAVIGVLRGAPQRVHINNPASTWMAIYSIRTASLNKTGKLKLEIYVSDTTDNTTSGKIQLAADGTVTQTSPANS